MSRAPKVCSDPECSNVGCDHDKQPSWSGSKRKRRRAGSGWKEQREAQFVMRRDKGRCHVCGEYGADEVDHVVSLEAGGRDHVSNKAPIHSKPCHERKTQDEARRGMNC